MNYDQWAAANCPPVMLIKTTPQQEEELLRSLATAPCGSIIAMPRDAELCEFSLECPEMTTTQGAD